MRRPDRRPPHGSKAAAKRSGANPSLSAHSGVAYFIMPGWALRRPDLPPAPKIPCLASRNKKGQVYLRHIKRLLTVAPFQAWRGSQPLIAQGLALLSLKHVKFDPLHGLLSP